MDRFRMVANFTQPGPESGAAGLLAARLDGPILKLHLSDCDGAIFYLAGPGRFVKGLLKVLEDLGIDPDDVRSEESPGY